MFRDHKDYRIREVMGQESSQHTPQTGGSLVINTAFPETEAQDLVR